MRLADCVDAAPAVRMGLAVAVAVLVWLGVLVAVGHWLGTPAPAPLPEQALDMRVVELDPPLPPKEPVSRALLKANPPITKPSKPVVPRPSALPEQPIAAKPTDARPAQSVVSSSPPATNASAPHPTTAPVEENQNQSPSQNPTAAAAAPGDSAARPIAQPLPELPDDLRDQAYRTVATARFTIHTDGSIEVDLIRPTPNPRLNQILLEVLHKWRFSPAMQAGHPVESRQDVRVHFNVD